MLLAAGLGERMRPLTDHTPKPMLRVAGRPLLEHHIRRLAVAGFSDLVINVSHLADQITDYFGDGERFGVRIRWSYEAIPLETAGGLVQALPLLGDAPFLVVNGDVWTDFPFEQLRGRPVPAAGAHLLLVDNPPQHPAGDFLLVGESIAALEPGKPGLTYAGIGLYTPGFLATAPAGRAPLRPLLDEAIAAGRLGGEHYCGQWVDVGTPERLQALDASVASSGR